MAGETRITIVGNLTRDPEVRYTQQQLAVVSLTVASTARLFDKQTNDWKDGDPLFLRMSAWRDLAENIAASLTVGSRIIATGILKQKSYEDKDGVKHTNLELEIEEIGPSLRYATATVQRAGGDRRTLAQERPVRQAPRPDAGPPANQAPQVNEPWYDETPF